MPQTILLSILVHSRPSPASLITRCHVGRTAGLLHGVSPSPPLSAWWTTPRFEQCNSPSPYVPALPLDSIYLLTVEDHPGSVCDPAVPTHVQGQALLEGDIETSYTEADNSVVVTTDCIKNIAYYVSLIHHQNLTARHDSGGICAASGHAPRFQLPHINKAFVTAEQLRWSRVPVPGEQGPTEHPHLFIRDGDEKRFVKVETIDTAFSGFVHVNYTTLKEVDRILSTSIDLSYTFAPIDTPTPTDPDVEQFAVPVRPRTFLISKHRLAAEIALGSVTLNTFVSDNSASVQATLYRMARLILAQNAVVQSVLYALPNKHYIPVDMGYIGVENIVHAQAEVLMPVVSHRFASFLSPISHSLTPYVLRLIVAVGFTHRLCVEQFNLQHYRPQGHSVTTLVTFGLTTSSSSGASMEYTNSNGDRAGFALHVSASVRLGLQIVAGAEL
ncbi:hypothetical protein C8R45DRAFT_1192710 [Mycena sanguinolenta]|nr:hypothetical protein C8R45DRAFT_1192710 [Mycena sanguinolenta]